MKHILLALALTLSACGAAVVPAEKTLITACSGYAVALNTLADFRAAGKLSATVILAVLKVDAAAGPLCDPSKPLPTDPAAALSLVESSATVLLGYIEGVR